MRTSCSRRIVLTSSCSAVTSVVTHPVFRDSSIQLIYWFHLTHLFQKLSYICTHEWLLYCHTMHHAEVIKNAVFVDVVTVTVHGLDRGCVPGSAGCEPES